MQQQNDSWDCEVEIICELRDGALAAAAVHNNNRTSKSSDLLGTKRVIRATVNDFRPNNEIRA